MKLAYSSVIYIYYFVYLSCNDSPKIQEQLRPNFVFPRSFTVQGTHVLIFLQLDYKLEEMFTTIIIHNINVVYNLAILHSLNSRLLFNYIKNNIIYIVIKSVIVLIITYNFFYSYNIILTLKYILIAK